MKGHVLVSASVVQQHDSRTLKGVLAEALWAIFTAYNTRCRQIPHFSVAALTLGVGIIFQAVGLFSFALP